MPYASPFVGYGYKSARRYYLVQAISATEEELADVFRAKQQAQFGTALPATFPHLTDLQAVGYSTFEDLDGAQQSELICAGLPSNKAKQALDELAKLLA